MKTTTQNKRDLDGVLLLDKPYGISSNRALQRARGLFRAKKAGHGGSLDPLATGMLPVCFGQATKYLQYVLDAPKRYFVTACLGVTTNTGDAEGEIISQCNASHITLQAVADVLDNFRGEIQQIPPMYSALKRDGQPLYKLARRGETVERPARTVTIQNLQPYSLCYSRLTLDVSCSKGTYIRSLVEDIGQVLGVGAHVVGLRRLSVAHFPPQAMQTWHSLQNPETDTTARLLPVDCLLQNYPSLSFSPDDVRRLQQGLRVPAEGTLQTIYRLYDEENQFFGLGQIRNDGELKPLRMMSANLEGALHK